MQLPEPLTFNNTCYSKRTSFLLPASFQCLRVMPVNGLVSKSGCATLKMVVSPACSAYAGNSVFVFCATSELSKHTNINNAVTIYFQLFPFMLFHNNYGVNYRHGHAHNFTSNFFPE
jgi:hypothetical protein